VQPADPWLHRLNGDHYWTMTQNANDEQKPRAEKEVAGALVAAVGLIALVVIVLIAIVSLPDDGKASNVVAVASSAFGVIGAIVGAYFGIRTAKNAVDQAGPNG
jgi:hypothetical protein